MSNIKNYTSQTNSHKGYTIEELRRLLGEGITSENIIKLINECFNYELVSGKGIRLIELKNNDFRNNTTKTYKIECTCEGGEGGGSGSGSGSGGDIDVDKGIAFDDDGRTVIADLYDYEKSGSPETEGIYPISLSKDGKLIVDMTTANINITASRKFAYHRFENTDIINNFTFKVEVEGSKLVVYKIETWISENGQVIDKEVYDEDNNPDVIDTLNNEKEITLYKKCSARLDTNNVSNAITRAGNIKIYYTIKGEEQTPATKTISTRFMHQIYYGYTCDYNATDPDHIAPERYEEDPNRDTQPCFKIYSNSDDDYDNGNHLTGKRIGIEIRENSNKYDLKIRNTETDTEYVLGYYNMAESQDGKHTLTFLPTSKTFNLTGLGPHGDESVFPVFFIPKSMTEITNMTSSIDGGQPWPILNGMLVERVLVNDYSYYGGDTPVNNIEYIVYTQKSSFITEVISNINIECTVSTI